MKLLTLTEVAKLINNSCRKTVERKITSGEWAIPHYRIGEGPKPPYVFVESEVMGWLKDYLKAHRVQYVDVASVRVQ